MQLSYFSFPALTVLVNMQMLIICIRFSNVFHILARELQQAKAEGESESERARERGESSRMLRQQTFELSHAPRGGQLKAVRSKRR